MKPEIKETQIFITKDGEELLKKEDYEKYKIQVLNVKQNIKYFMDIQPISACTMPISCIAEKFKTNKKSQVGYYLHNFRQIFISEKALNGFPEPIWCA